MTTTPEAAAAEPAAAAPEPQAAPETVAETKEADAPPEPEAAVENGAVEPAKDTPKKRGRKRKVSVTEDKTPGSEDVPAAVDGAVDAAADSTAAAVEKSPKEKKPAAKKAKAPPKPKAAAASSATPAKRKIGRPRKTVVKEESESEDETESELRQRVDALPEDVKAKFGSIVWAKMVGFPYWPALITDPRLIHSKYHASALKEIETKYFVCFYQSNDFSPVLFKNIEAWDDSKHSYRTGHPTKDAKAPKRRSQLMTAIELADKDAPLAIEDRMEGLMKAVPEEPESSPEEVEEKPPAPKKKMGRPPGSKNKPKTASGAAASATEAASPAPAKGKRGRKKSTEEPEEDKVATPETPDDEETVPPLTKDEIKAKVASRKSPSKKKAAASAEDKSAPAAAKKATKASGGTKGEYATTAAKAGGAGELDSKRKKEIELVVPRKSVKSADIREATEEAARKKPGPREKPKDKGDYKVGNLTQFAGKMNRLYANESSKNNDELIVLLTQLFEEKMVYRSDAERSGVAAVIAVLRKSQNPTVAQTASAVRKHLMHVLNNDVIEEPTPALKKHKVDGADAGEPKASKKQKTSPVADAAGDAPSSTPVPAELVDTKSEANGSSEAQEETVTEAPQAEAKPEAGVTEAMPVEENKPSPTQEPEQKLAPTEVTTEETTKQEPTSTPAPASPIKSDDPVLVPTSPKPDPSGDKHRMVCIDMLKKSLAPIGERSEEIAREIEAHVFERFSESNEEYRSCARSITFGLKKHAHVRERLKHGDLHALELAYTPDEILKPT